MQRSFLTIALFSTMTVSGFGCSASGSSFDSNDGGGSDGGGFLGDGGAFGDGSPGGGGGRTLLYVHDNTTLYSVDATDPKLASTTIGKFDCIGGSGQATSMTDIAIDKDGKLYGISTSVIYLDMKIVGSTVQCAAGAKNIPQAGAKVAFYGASFAPVGTLDPNSETLVVGNTDGELYRVDVTTGNITLINNFGAVPAGMGFLYPGGAWEMSGDIVFLENGGNPIGFATVRDCKSPPSSTTCNPTDTLIQIDLKKFAQGPAGSGITIRGPIVKSSSCTDATPKYGSMYGIAAFQDKIIGFAHAGFTVSISNNDGTACLIANSQPKWDGAGVTTTAPVVAPPPR